MHRRWLAVAITGLLLVAGCVGTGEEVLEEQGLEPGTNATQPDAQGPSQEQQDANRTDRTQDTANQTAEDDEANQTQAEEGDQAAPGTNTSTTSEPYAPGWPPVQDATIRPGVAIVGDGSLTGAGLQNAWSCTSNFLFTSPDNRSLYLGTAAHCVDDRDIGDDVAIDNGTVTGTLVYASFQTMEEQGVEDRHMLETNDFALVELPAEARSLAHPAALRFGGPTGMADVPTTGDEVVTYGNTYYRDGARVLNPRHGYVTGSDPWYTSLAITGPSIWGDSGSLVMDGQGRALGVMVHLTNLPVATDTDHGPATNGATNLAKAVAYMEETTDLDVELATWPGFQASPLPGPR